ncbi:hypothetical protein [Abyssalbus ytuae]|uniref:Uncharacterized protein n=1 Tax=Abyssalbus ytuae TaxID=2926907 RepID=A0A9E6ZVJ5_9FLAO|nr:hypothetical protein [Abyssalbus ytuae]UOB17581.1 hypothetical protein MQE35_17810 [Abyssalbus ytuae]
MKLLIFRTDIKTKKKVKHISPLFRRFSNIHKWYIDLEDVDNVLKIEASGNLTENDVVKFVNSMGFYCEPLPE